MRTAETSGTAAAPADVGPEAGPALAPTLARFLASPLSLLFVVILAFAVYAPLIDDWFRADDFWLLRSAQLTEVPEYTLEAFDFRDRDPIPQFVFYRPLFVTSFRLAYVAFGTNAAGYHLLNLGLHVASVSLVWLIARRLFRAPFAAPLAAAIFAFHPAYTETVAWIARGNTVMATVPYLLTFWLFMRYRDGGEHAGRFYLAAVLSYLAAILYHPNALTLFAVLPAYTFLLAGKPSDALRPTAWVAFVPFALLTAGMIGIQTWVRNDVGQEEAFAFGSHQYAKYGEYLGIALFPVSGADWQELSLPADGLPQAAELGASLLMIAAALMLIRRRDPSNVGVFVTWWFFTSLAGNSTLVVLPVSPAQLYLPGASLALFLVVAGMAVADEVPARLAPFVSKAAWGAAALVVVIVGILLLTHENQSRDLGGENQRFVRQLRQEIPSLQPGSVLYVVDAPFDLLVFNDDALEAAVQLYYGDVEVQAISPDELSTATLTPGDHVFRYVPR